MRQREDMYYLIIHQPGGCDYTIECGTKAVTFTADSPETAEFMAKDIINDYTSESRLESAILIKADQVTYMDTESVYRERGN